MTAIDFPNDPTVGDLFTVGDITYEWTGTVWKSVTVLQTLPHASTHASAGSDAVTVAQSQVTGLSTELASFQSQINGKSPLAGSTSITTVGTVTSATSPTAADSKGLRNITISSSNPSGGASGDVWLTF
jgi:hypothetical protein